MVFAKNLMIVILFGFLVVFMIFWGVTMIEAKGKKLAEEPNGNHIVYLQQLNNETVGDN
ncbi:hypothetical protein [Litchfieldia alkalitelluris]|uniref:hypothetical protein n=1 Tax=Litchfieldia alkalitelluris TaxID=304268 RepID=UPI0014728023|nr:hypothetical protein [Litchfieldia alkalitelluris]